MNEICTYPDCYCPFDMPDDGGWCLIGKQKPKQKNKGYQMNLQPCACGQTPHKIVLYQEINNYSLITGDCCGEWLVEARTDWEIDKQKLNEMYAKAWNATPRPVLPSMSAIVDKSFVLKQLTKAKKFLASRIDPKEHDIQEELDIEEMIRAIDAVLKKIDKEIPKLEV